MMVKDGVSDRGRNVTLLSLIADNSGKFDICALVYDVITNNKCTYYDNKTDEFYYEPVLERLLDVKKISKSAYIDLKKIINYIKKNYVSNKKDDGILVVVKEGEISPEYISKVFDDVFIKRLIEDYYHDNLYKEGIS